MVLWQVHFELRAKHKATKMYRRALVGTKKALGVEHPDTLSSVDALALVLQAQGKYKAAEEMDRRAPAERGCLAWSRTIIIRSRFE